MAFNHLHIFVDPHPDPSTSWVERKRLFKLPRSTWMDYNHDLTSVGGGVFERSAKLIKISPQMKEIFEIQEDVLDPNTLIRYGLKAKVDVIWNGGVGTFIKSSTESHDIVGDKNNDMLRVNGCEVRAKMIIEGGNLGCTQRGRIEYARTGGRINTDFIDNAAGVNCSDMEVNIKIALAEAMAKNKITLQERNVALRKMEKNIADLILHHTNFLQTRSLIVAKLQAEHKLEQYRRLVQLLAKEGGLDREVEFIPSDEEFSRMNLEKHGPSVPTIAVIFAYAKMHLYNQLISSEVPDEEMLHDCLISYFPKEMHVQFKEEMMQHKLKREIITTQFVNSIINRMGCTFISNLAENTGASVTKIVKVHLSLYSIYGLRKIWNTIDDMGNKINVLAYSGIIIEMHKFIEGVVHWFSRSYKSSFSIQKIVNEFRDGVNELAAHIDEILDTKSLEMYHTKVSKFIDMELSEDLSVRIAKLHFLSPTLPIIQLTNSMNVDRKRSIPVIIIAKIYFKLGLYLHFIWLRKVAVNLQGDYWQRLAIKSLFDEMQDQQTRLAEEIAQEMKNDEDYQATFDRWSANNEATLNRYNDMIQDLKKSKELDLSRLIIIIKYLEGICSA